MEAGEVLGVEGENQKEINALRASTGTQGRTEDTINEVLKHTLNSK